MNIDNRPKVSVVLTTYNRPEFALRAIKSVLKQSLHPLEIIVVEDGSHSHLYSKFSNQSNTSLVFIYHIENLGLAAARNTGISAAQGDFIAFIDDDDAWEPEKLEKQYTRYVASPNFSGLVYCGSKTVDKIGTVVAKHYPKFEGNIQEAILRERFSTIPSSLFVSSNTLRFLQNFDEDLQTGIDHDFFFKAAKLGFQAIACQESLVVEFFQGHTKMTNRLSERKQGLKRFIEKWSPYFRKITNNRSSRLVKNYESRYLAQCYVNHWSHTGDWLTKFLMLRELIANPRYFVSQPRFLIVVLGNRWIYNIARKHRARS